jgi:hypothetical protein
MLGNEDGQLCPGQQNTDRGNVPRKTIFKEIEHFKRVKVFTVCFLY